MKVEDPLNVRKYWRTIVIYENVLVKCLSSSQPKNKHGCTNKLGPQYISICQSVSVCVNVAAYLVNAV